MDRKERMVLEAGKFIAAQLWTLVIILALATVQYVVVWPVAKAVKAFLGM